MDQILQVAEILLSLVVTVVLLFAAPYVARLAEKIGGEKAVSMLGDMAETAVRAVEQTLSTSSNSLKKVTAVSLLDGFLEAKDLKFDPDHKDAAIEAAVLKLKRTMPGPLEFSNILMDHSEAALYGEALDRRLTPTPNPVPIEPKNPSDGLEPVIAGETPQVTAPAQNASIQVFLADNEGLVGCG